MNPPPTYLMVIHYLHLLQRAVFTKQLSEVLLTGVEAQSEDPKDATGTGVILKARGKVLVTLAHGGYCLNSMSHMSFPVRLRRPAEGALSVTTVSALTRRIRPAV